MPGEFLCHVLVFVGVSGRLSLRVFKGCFRRSRDFCSGVLYRHVYAFTGLNVLTRDCYFAAADKTYSELAVRASGGSLSRVVPKKKCRVPVSSILPEERQRQNDVARVSFAFIPGEKSRPLLRMPKKKLLTDKFLRLPTFLPVTHSHRLRGLSLLRVRMHWTAFLDTGETIEMYSARAMQSEKALAANVLEIHTPNTKEGSSSGVHSTPEKTYARSLPFITPESVDKRTPILTPLAVDTLPSMAKTEVEGANMKLAIKRGKAVISSYKELVQCEYEATNEEQVSAGVATES